LEEGDCQSQSKLQAQIASFHQDQKYYMAKVGDKVAAQTVPGIVTQDELLYLPSDLTASERAEMGVDALAIEESKWRLPGAPERHEVNKCTAKTKIQE
jgi:hypothetical protein